MTGSSGRRPNPSPRSGSCWRHFSACQWWRITRTLRCRIPAPQGFAQPLGQVGAVSLSHISGSLRNRGFARRCGGIRRSTRVRA